MSFSLYAQRKCNKFIPLVSWQGSFVVTPTEYKWNCSPCKQRCAVNKSSLLCKILFGDSAPPPKQSPEIVPLWHHNGLVFNPRPNRCKIQVPSVLAWSWGREAVNRGLNVVCKVICKSVEVTTAIFFKSGKTKKVTVNGQLGNYATVVGDYVTMEGPPVCIKVRSPFPPILI